MRRLLSVLVVLLAACSSPTSVDSGLMTVSASDNYVTLSNYTAEPVSYDIGTPEIFGPLVDRVCAIPEGCFRSVAAHASVRIAYENIRGYRAGAQTVIVNHWHGLGFAPADSVHHVEIAFR